jgi:hypothetical protein
MYCLTAGAVETWSLKRWDSDLFGVFSSLELPRLQLQQVLQFQVASLRLSGVGFVSSWSLQSGANYAYTPAHSDVSINIVMLIA